MLNPNVSKYEHEREIFVHLNYRSAVNFMNQLTTIQLHYKSHSEKCVHDYTTQLFQLFLDMAYVKTHKFFKMHQFMKRGVYTFFGITLIQYLLKLRADKAFHNYRNVHVVTGEEE